MAEETREQRAVRELTERRIASGRGFRGTRSVTVSVTDTPDGQRVDVDNPAGKGPDGRTPDR
jgi:hypothetical protein